MEILNKIENAIKQSLVACMPPTIGDLKIDTESVCIDSKTYSVYYLHEFDDFKSKSIQFYISAVHGVLVLFSYTDKEGNETMIHSFSVDDINDSTIEKINKMQKNKFKKYI